MKEITIKDIASEAGVSISTVSRVINGNYPVRQEVREKVEAVMKQLEYHPNAVARSLRINKTNLIALVVADLSNHFFMEIAKGLEIEVSKMGYHLVIASSGGNIEKERELIDTLVGKRIDGLVIASSDSDGDKIQKCLSLGIPVVLVDRTIKNITTNQILWKDFECSYKLTRLLTDNGHKRIGIVNVTLTNPNGSSRLEGFKQAITDAGIPVSEAFISPSNFSQRQAYDYVMEIMQKENRPTAIYCANNIMLEGTLQALRELELKVYDDVSLVAFGRLECNKYITPQITSADQDSLEMGHRAGEILSGLLAGKNTYSTQIILDSKIKERGSVKKIR
ncbi:substrate-binding domain-containing protein [Clostridium sp. MCC353]|uniref:LacI family DNA-binding transcriptional regulator n=1 Tax=Clostridium sp. MCC353 TaxID=2592646 RepID=UPI001C01E20A|nr:LacI family DNA-binding transcriptional regulator [Clostridium sp. MCC353]MBT9775233.1 substrate-binding domain-containing protein [Clostridium sp. MCC353]